MVCCSARGPINGVVIESRIGYINMRTYIYIFLQIIGIAFTRNSPLFRWNMKPGFMRGIDYYSPARFISVMANAANEYKKTHGKYPNLIKPRRFNEKIFYRKFFDIFKIPESGNKLLTATFIPESLKNDVQCPEIVWHSTTPKLPDNKDIPEGYYYLKANHGSSMFTKVKFPLSQTERDALEKESSVWLKNEFGFWDGEWWYCAFEKEILLEKSVSKNRDSVAIGLYIFNGTIRFVILNKKTEGGDEINWLDENFNLYQVQSSQYPRINDFQLSEDLSLLKDIATSIAGNHDFVRIDLLMGDDEKYYLGEVTFSPGNALTVRPDELEDYLGRCWPR